jgi:iron complex transport system permease protein
MSPSRPTLRAVAVLVALAGLLAAVGLLAAKTGPVAVSWADLGTVLTDGSARESLPMQSRILLDLRLPRIFLGGLVGAALAVAGTTFQGLLRNPLADPYLLGVSGGGALGAVFILTAGAAAGAPLIVPAAACAGSLAAVAAVWRLAAGAGALPPTALILSGVIVSAFCSALVMFLTAIAPAGRVQGALFWMMGSLAAPPPGILPAVAGAVALGVGLAVVSGPQLNALSLGEETAAHLGVNARRVRLRLFFAASVVTGAAVAAAGLVGFVGLVVPHALRALIGADHRLLLPAAALAGASTLVLADTAARSLLPPAEIPVGVVTALLGAPFFLALLRRRRGWMG